MKVPLFVKITLKKSMYFRCFLEYSILSMYFVQLELVCLFSNRKKMFYHLSSWLQQYWTVFNVVHYSSFRAMAALLTTLFCFFSYGSWFIDRSRLFFRSPVRAYTPKGHKKKDGMPSMGGVFIIGVVVLNVLL